MKNRRFTIMLAIMKAHTPDTHMPPIGNNLKEERNILKNVS